MHQSECFKLGSMTDGPLRTQVRRQYFTSCYTLSIALCDRLNLFRNETYTETIQTKRLLYSKTYNNVVEYHYKARKGHQLTH